MKTKEEIKELIQNILKTHGLSANKIKVTDKNIYIEIQFQDEEKFQYLKPLQNKIEREIKNCLAFEVFHSVELELTIKISLVG